MSQSAKLTHSRTYSLPLLAKLYHWRQISFLFLGFVSTDHRGSITAKLDCHLLFHLCLIVCCRLQMCTAAHLQLQRQPICHSLWYSLMISESSLASLGLHSEVVSKLFHPIFGILLSAKVIYVNMSHCILFTPNAIIYSILFVI